MGSKQICSRTKRGNNVDSRTLNGAIPKQVLNLVLEDKLTFGRIKVSPLPRLWSPPFHYLVTSISLLELFVFKKKNSKKKKKKEKTKEKSCKNLKRPLKMFLLVIYGHDVDRLDKLEPLALLT